MDLMTFLSKLEADFFYRLRGTQHWNKQDLRHHFDEAVKNTLVTTYTRVIVDAGEVEPGGKKSDS